MFIKDEFEVSEIELVGLDSPLKSQAAIKVFACVVAFAVGAEAVK